MMKQSLWRPEIVFTVQPTFFAAPVGLFAAWLAGAYSWLHVQDFEVDAAFELGFLRANGRLHSLALRWETRITRRFSRVSSISNRMIERMGDRRRGERAPVLFPNWGDIEAIRPALPQADNRLREELGLQKKTILLYSGNMGAKQGLGMLLPLVKALAEDDRVHFIFCGEGPYRPQMERMVADCDNVTMLPLQPVARLGELLNAADIHLLPQLRGAADLVMPSKLCDMLASGRPVLAIAGTGTQLAQVVEGCGLAVPDGDPAALVAAAKQLIYNPEIRQRMGFRAREYAVKYLGKEQVLRRFEREVLAMLRPAVIEPEAQLARTYRG
jgi:colanic acid biosynthesis glycosyl transferase WcaI